MFTKIAISGLMTAVAALAVASQGGRAMAQYPVPQGSCVITTSDTVVDPHAAVSVGATVLDVNGKAVPGVAVEISISRQPGGDAALSASGGATDAAGAVTAQLDAGSTGGVIGLTARTDAVSCSATVVVGEGAVLGAVSLPDTGSGHANSGDSLAEFGAFLLGVVGIAVVGLAASRPRANRG